MTLRRFVVVESPYRAEDLQELEANDAYALDAMRDCIDRGEVPFASHQLYPAVLDEWDAAGRELGLYLNREVIRRADAVVVYEDRGISPGMLMAIEFATRLDIPIEYRSLASWAEDLGAGGW